MTEKHKSQRSESANSPPVRAAYIYLHEKRTKRANGMPLKTARYDATLLFPKLHVDPMQCQNYQWLAKHCMDAAVKAWGTFPQGGHWPIQDGDAVKAAVAPTVPGQAPTTPKEYPWRKGHWCVEVTYYMDPGPRIAVLQAGQITEIPARVVNGQAMYKSGDVFVFNMHAYTFHNEKFGCNFGFEGAVKMADGEPIGSSGPKSTAQMFGGIAPVGAMSVAPPPGPAVLPNAPPVAPAMPPLPPGVAMPTAAPALPVPAAAAPPSAPLPPVPGVSTLPPFPVPGR